MNGWLIGVGVFWLVCGVIGYGMTYHYFAVGYMALHHANWRGTLAISILTAVIGPAGLLVAVLGSDGNRGVRFRPVTDEESWREHHRRWPSLSRDDWHGGPWTPTRRADEGNGGHHAA